MKSIPQRWRNLNITNKFGSAFGLLLSLILMVAITGYVSLLLVRDATEAVILTSTEIQRLVLEMDGGLEKARRLHRDFFLQYPKIGLSKARELYLQPSVHNISEVVGLSAELKQLIAKSKVSEALRGSRVNLNLYLSSAKRFSDTFSESVELVTILAAPETGLLSQMAQHSALLKEILKTDDDPVLINIYHDMRSFEQNYWNTRQRPLMQSSFNEAFQLHKAIEETDALDPEKKALALTYLHNYESTAHNILAVDAKIRSKFNDFTLQSETVDPVSRELIALADAEVERGRAQIDKTNRLAAIILIATALVGLLLAAIIAQVLNYSITHNVVKLTETAGELQAGNLEVYASIETADELGHLAKSFNAMAARIRDLVGNLEQKVEELQFTNAVLTTQQNTSVDGILVVDAEGRITSCNQRFSHMWGIPSEVMASGSDKSAQQSVLDKLVDPEAFLERVKYLYDHPDEESWDELALIGEITFERYSAPMYGQDGKYYGRVWYFRDITERKRTEIELAQYREQLEELVKERTAALQIESEERKIVVEALQKSETRYRSLFENMFHGVAVYRAVNDGEDFIFVDFNKAGEKIDNIGRENLIGQKVTEIFPAVKEFGLFDVFQRVWKTGKPEQHPVGIYSDGRISGWKEYFVYKLPSEEIVVVYSDETLRKRAEEELQRAKLDAETANRAKSDFLANMSHEIRSPMNAILGFTEILKGKVVDPRLSYYLQSIHSSGKSLLRLINDILDLSKVEAGKLSLTYTAVSPQQLFKEMETIFGQKIKDKGLQWITEIPDDLPESLILDETRLRQVLFNLMGNAVKFTDNGYIKLSVQYQHPGNKYRSILDLIISVEDTGAGIPEDQRQSIFDAFTQLKGQKNLQSAGTGLGLTITKRLIELMNGEITLKSEVGKGSTFSIMLKEVEVAAADLLKARDEGKIDFHSITFEKSTLLLADDIEYNRELIKSYMEGYGFAFVEAENGVETIEKIRESRPDLVLLDMKMPEMDGYEVSAIMNSDQYMKDIPVIAITASAMKEDKEIISNLCDAYLRKPISQADLILEVMKFLPHTIKEAVPVEEKDQVVEGPMVPPAPEEMEILHDLALRGNMRKIEAFAAHLEQVDKKYLPFASKLGGLARNFRSEEILKLVNDYQTKAG